jgi:plasmid stabilization system protein ParE
VDYGLRYTQKAISDLAEIIGYIADEDAEASSRFGNSLLDHLELLTGFAHMGKTIPKRADVRELFHSPLLATTE